jgi:hydrogenase maturation factor
MARYLPIGKVPIDLLSELLAHLPRDDSVVFGPGIGHDAAVVRLDKHLLVLKTDPITFVSEELGWYAVNVNANDVACLGGIPRWFLACVLLPEARTTPELVRQIVHGLRSACASLGISLVGGHTEIATGLDHPIVAGMMVGTVEPGLVIQPDRAQPGDALLLARGIAIEGTAILARECAGQLANRFDAPFLDRCREFLYDPGISVVQAARILHQHLGNHLRALHDPTEGGLATGLHELAVATGLGVSVDLQAIPIYEETQALCHALALDPLGLIASGALLAVVAPDAAVEAVHLLHDEGIPAAVIGRLEADRARRELRTPSGPVPLPDFEVDELARLFAEGRC